MARPLRTAAAVLAGLLVLAGLALAATGDLSLAGLCFLGTSIVIYFRETALADD
ncbi:hypothetical protein SAMN04487947_3445 [Halogeometricum rufum]|jgi:hypothetical protein|uniref:Uncharacterized protein n=1 Tax=Halogeometricum rufum TaxID=553469 RepID=A0A1I6ILG2_9EURY|nr:MULTISPECIES: hypothetical protein [Halogeometricum]SFR67607.1 hypothetical protein SAMN04487947_3445 [Halogeometricum rufum]